MERRQLSLPLEGAAILLAYYSQTGGHHTVFGRKQDLTRELEEKLNTAQFHLEDMQGQVSQVQGCMQQMLPLFESQIIAQSEMDKELTKVVKHTYDTIEEASGSMNALDQLAMELTGMRGQLEDEEQDKKRMREAARAQQEHFEAAMQENQRFATPVTALQEVQIGLSEDVSKVRTELSQMMDYAKQMTVASLNSAIEAGRMGDTGKKFVEASEEVRVLSSAYERAAGNAVRQIDDVSRRIRKLEEQLEALTKLCKDNSAAFSRLSKDIAQQGEICEKAAERHYLEKTAAISDAVKKLANSSSTIDSLQHQTLSDIEHIGESFINEQEARKDLESIVDQLMKAMRG